MPVNRISEYSPDMQLPFPVSGGGSAISIGAILRKGATQATMNGQLRPATGNNINNKSLAILQEAHATANDTDVAGTTFTTHPCDLIIPLRILQMEYSQASADLITATQAVTTTALTLTNLENNIQAAFLYVVSGTGAGQTNYLTASAAGSATLKAAFATPLDTSSKLIKILPRFHELCSLTSNGLRLSSQDVAGVMRCVVLETLLVRGNNEVAMSPVSHAALTGLSSLQSLRFEAKIALVDTIVYQLA